jgi:hypothetical protein
MSRELSGVREQLGHGLFSMVAGPDGPANRARIHDTPGPRWFGEDRPIRRVHADASMFVGGLRALLLQSLHPLAMAGVAGHSDYRGDPWGRLQRTSTFLAVTTFGPADEAQRAVDRVRGIHRRVTGVAAGGRGYRASDPHLLEWFHIAEVDSFLLAHQRYGADPLDQHGRDGYVADTARIAAALGVPDPPPHRTAARGPDRRVPARVAQHRRRPRRSAVPAADPAATGAGPGALRPAGRDIGGHAAVLGQAAAAAALPATRRGHGDSAGGAHARRGYPLGDDAAGRSALVGAERGETFLAGWPRLSAANTRVATQSRRNINQPQHLPH